MSIIKIRSLGLLCQQVLRGFLSGYSSWCYSHALICFQIQTFWIWMTREYLEIFLGVFNAGKSNLQTLFILTPDKLFFISMIISLTSPFSMRKIQFNFYFKVCLVRLINIHTKRQSSRPSLWKESITCWRQVWALCRKAKRRLHLISKLLMYDNLERSEKDQRRGGEEKKYFSIVLSFLVLSSTVLLTFHFTLTSKASRKL